MRPMDIEPLVAEDHEEGIQGAGLGERDGPRGPNHETTDGGYGLSDTVQIPTDALQKAPS
jgi:hypothetical protein